ILLCSWLMEREQPTARQVAGMLISLSGIAVIVTRGDPASLVALEGHAGDAWILLAMPIWGVYSVLLKRSPPGLGALEMLFVIAAAGVLMLAPFYLREALRAPPVLPSPEALGGILYIGIAASVIAFSFWNRAVDIVGANAAGFTLHLLPAFGTALAILALGESFAAFHALGFALIVLGVVLATARSPGRGSC
ncbi:MAG TPA: DMT family transporter, partial [Burkholderiales bacterium]